MLNKNQALEALKNNKTIFTPTWYISSFDGEYITANCGYENCCDMDWNNFEEFWSDFGDMDLIIL